MDLALQGGGYDTETWWELTDTCGLKDNGLDGNETFGPWTTTLITIGTNPNLGLVLASLMYGATRRAHGTREDLVSQLPYL
jgi:hypothetical protein